MLHKSFAVQASSASDGAISRPGASRNRLYRPRRTSADTVDTTACRIPDDELSLELRKVPPPPQTRTHKNPSTTTRPPTHLRGHAGHDTMHGYQSCYPSTGHAWLAASCRVIPAWPQPACMCIPADRFLGFQCCGGPPAVGGAAALHGHDAHPGGRVLAGALPRLAGLAPMLDLPHARALHATRLCCACYAPHSRRLLMHPPRAPCTPPGTCRLSSEP